MKAKQSSIHFYVPKPNITRETYRLSLQQGLYISTPAFQSAKTKIPVER